MGTLAKQGIFNGRRVALEGPGASFIRGQLSQYERLCLGRFGYGRIAERVLSGSPLSVKDIENLLVRAPIPVLIKLVELRHGVVSCVDPRPLAMLPVNQWLNSNSVERVVELSRAHLQQFPQTALRVAIDPIDFKKVDSSLLEIMSVVASDYPDLVFVGPQGRELLPWLRSLSSAGHAKLHTELHLLQQYIEPVCLSKAEISAGNAASHSSQLDFLSQKDGRCEVTNVAHWSSSGELANELFRLHERSMQSHLDLWIPSYEVVGQKANGQRATVRDYQLLRLLAVGSIVFTAIRFRRASTRYFSLASLPLARIFGANDLGFGAVDRATAKLMKIQSISALRQISYDSAVKPRLSFLSFDNSPLI